MDRVESAWPGLVRAVTLLLRSRDDRGRAGAATTLCAVLRTFSRVVGPSLIAAALIVSTWAGASSAALAPLKATKISAADTWLIKALGAEQKVGSVRITGAIKQGKTTMALSLLVNGDGEGGGTFVQNGFKILLKRVGPIIYFNAPTKFWSAHATATQTKEYGGKWIEVSALDTRFQSFDQFLDARDLVAAVFAGHTTPLTLSKRTTLDGHKVIIVSDTVKSKGKTSTGHMYISTSGSPVVLKIEEKTPAQTGLIDFSHYGKPLSITTPPEPINLT